LYRYIETTLPLFCLDEMDPQQNQNNLNGSRPETDTGPSRTNHYNITQNRHPDQPRKSSDECIKLDSSEMKVSITRDIETSSRDDNTSKDSSFEDNIEKEKGKIPVENKEDEDKTFRECSNFSEDFSKLELDNCDENVKSFESEIEQDNNPIEVESDMDNKLSEGNVEMEANYLKQAVQDTDIEADSSMIVGQRDNSMLTPVEVQFDVTNKNSQGNAEMIADSLKKAVSKELGSTRQREVTQFVTQSNSDDDNNTNSDNSMILEPARLTKSEKNDSNIDNPSSSATLVTQAVGDPHYKQSDKPSDNENILRDVQKQITNAEERRESEPCSLALGHSLELVDTLSSEPQIHSEDTAETGVSDKMLNVKSKDVLQTKVSFRDQPTPTLPVQAEDDPDCKCSEKPPIQELERMQTEANNQPNIDSYRDIQHSIPDHHVGSPHQTNEASSMPDEEINDSHLESDIDRGMAQLSDQTFVKENHQP